MITLIAVKSNQHENERLADILSFSIFGVHNHCSTVVSSLYRYRLLSYVTPIQRI